MKAIGAAFGGIKVISAGGWFAARPSGTEDVFKIYAESFRSDAHLRQILTEAQTIVGAVLAGQTPPRTDAESAAIEAWENEGDPN